METIWKISSGLLLVLQLCNGLPLDLEHTYADAHTQFLTGLVAILLTVCSVICLAGCLCCQRGNGFKDKKQQEFQDSPVGVSIASNLDHGHVNPIAHGGEFTIFTPLSPPHQNNNVFLAHQQIITRVDEDYRSGDIDVTDWFSTGEQEFPRTQLKYIRELGKGWFGRVVEGTAVGLPNTTSPSLHIRNGTTNQHSTNLDHPLASPSSNTTAAPRWTPVVVRILDAGAGANQRLHFLHDATIYRAGTHANVLRLEGRCLDTVPLLLLQEFCAKGDLKQYLLSQKTSGDSFLTSELPLRWCWQLASALKHLHSYKVAHPDLATRNCQVDDNLQLKLGDYGTSVAKYPEDYYHGSEVVPVRWRAPETIVFTATTIQQKTFNAEGNIWSFGISMWEILEFGALPYSWLSNDEVVSQVLGPSNVRLPKPKCKILYTDYIYRLMQLCWSTVESRPAITQIELMLLDLLQVYQHTHETNCEDSSNAPVSLQDFDNRWDNFKSNTIVKTDNQQNITSLNQTEDTVTVLNFNNAVNTSPSLRNLAGSLDNLRENENKQLASWLENIASSTGDLSFVKGLSDAINDLDNAIALENVSSSESSTRPNSGNVKHGRNKIHFQLGPIQSKSNYLTTDNNKNSLLLPRTSSESETEDENWKRKIERGAYTEKVRQKSRSVADLMVLTHIDTSESDSETMPSVDTRVGHRNSHLFGSEGNLLNVESRFQEELRKLQVERRDSLLFVPERKSTLIADEQQDTPNLPVYNVYNVVTISPVKVPNINLEQIIHYEKDLELERGQKADSPDIVTSKYLKENSTDVPDIISSCNGAIDVGSSNASTETLDNLDNTDASAKSRCLGFESDVSCSYDDNTSVINSRRIVPKLIEIIENNVELMDFIIEKYDSHHDSFFKDNPCKLSSENETCSEIINFGEVRVENLSHRIEDISISCMENSNESVDLTNSFLNTQVTPPVNDDYIVIEAINPYIKIDCEQFINTLISDAIDVYSDKQQTVIQATQNFINTEIVQYEDSIKVINFNPEESSVILGACDDYSIDLYASLKTTVDSAAVPAPLQQIYSSAKSEDTEQSKDTSSNKINFSLDTWDKFLGSSFERNEDYEDTGMFSQPQSLLFIENSDKLNNDSCDNFGILLNDQEFTDLKDVMPLENESENVLNSTYVIESKDEGDEDAACDANYSEYNDGLDVSDINIELEDGGQGLNETFTYNEEESIWKSSGDGGWFLHPQIDGIPTGNILKAMSETDRKEHSVGFDMDDDVLAAVRNELIAKLPQAQRASNEQVEDTDDSDASTSSDKNEMVMSYNYCNKQLSPILEESYSELLNSGQSTPNCTVNSTSSSVSTDSADDTNGTNGNNTWSDSPDHSVKLSSTCNVSDSEDDSPQLPVDIVDLPQLSRPKKIGQQQVDCDARGGVHVLRRNDDSISDGCMTRSLETKGIDAAEGDDTVMNVDLLEHVPVCVGTVAEKMSCSTPCCQSHVTANLALTTSTSSFLDHERTAAISQQAFNLSRVTLTLNNSQNISQLEESSASSDTTTYVTASDGSFSSTTGGGHTLLNFRTKGGSAIIPPLNSPEDRLPWRPVETVVGGLGGGGLLQAEQIVQKETSLNVDNEIENEMIPSGDDIIEVSSAFLNETSCLTGIPSADERQLSQDSDTMPIDELQMLQLQEKQQRELIEERKVLCDKDLDGDPNHHYINQDKALLDNNQEPSKHLEYFCASYMNRLNTKHLNNPTNTIESPTNLYDDVSTEDHVDEYAYISSITSPTEISVQDHNSLSPKPEQEDYVNIIPELAQNHSGTKLRHHVLSLRDYVNVPATVGDTKVVSNDTLRDYVNTTLDGISNGRDTPDLKDVDDIITPPSEIDLDVNALEDGIGDVYTPLEDIRFEGPAADLHLMSTSFSDSNDLGDEHDEDWDSGSDTGSSSSGLFIWKEGEHEACVKALHAAPDTHTEQVSPLDEIREESEDTSSGSDVDEDAEGIEFVPSAWDKYALPAKSALRSPEKTLELKPRGVWFKKQKYHCIYEYPREPESPIPQQAFDLWQPAAEYPMCPAEWDMDHANSLNKSSSSDVTKHIRANDHYVPEYHIDEHFYIRSASKPFELSSLYGSTSSGRSQFFPGSRSGVDGPVDYWLRPINNNGSDYTENGSGLHVGGGASGSSGYGSEVSTTPTPDSGADDSGASSGELLSDASEQGPLPLKRLCQLAASANGLFSNHHYGVGPGKDGIRKMPTKMEIGGLRHTRNKLKLDLPPSPSAFTNNKTFNVGSVSEDDEPIAKRNSSMTFSTFGKSRFLVQQVATPPDDDTSRTCGLDGRTGKNVSFEALPYKPRLTLLDSNYANYNQCSSNSSREDVYSSKEHISPVNNVTITSVLGGNANCGGKVEVVRGEASLLDSADEDSGIESSTLDNRKRKPSPSLLPSPSAPLTTVFTGTGTVMDI